MMTELNIDVSPLFGSPEIDSVVEWVPKVLAVGGLIITERDGELTIQPKPSYEDDQPELPPIPVSPERAAHLFHESPNLWERLHLVLADLDHANRHSHIRKDILVQMIEYNRTIGGLKLRCDWYVLRTWKRRATRDLIRRPTILCTHNGRLRDRRGMTAHKDSGGGE